MRVISTRRVGANKRKFSMGTRLWPPAKTIASSSANATTASSSVAGATYSKAGGFTSYMPLNSALRLPQPLPLFHQPLTPIQPLPNQSGPTSSSCKPYPIEFGWSNSICCYTLCDGFLILRRDKTSNRNLLVFFNTFVANLIF